MASNTDRLVSSGVIPQERASRLTDAEQKVIEEMSESELTQLEAISERVKKAHQDGGGDVDDLESNIIV